MNSGNKFNIAFYKQIAIRLPEGFAPKNSDKLKEPSISLSDEYKILVDTRKFEIENFIKRTTFSWTASAVGIALSFSDKLLPIEKTFIASIGFWFSVYFSLAARGAKFWQEVWEKRVNKFEESHNIKIFSIPPNVSNAKFFLFRPFRLSPSAITMILSDLVTIFWFGLLVIGAYDAIKFKQLYLFPIWADGDIHWSSVILSLFWLIAAVYIALFFVYKRAEDATLVDIGVAESDDLIDLIPEAIESEQPNEIPDNDQLLSGDL